MPNKILGWWSRSVLLSTWTWSTVQPLSRMAFCCGFIAYTHLYLTDNDYKEHTSILPWFLHICGFCTVSWADIPLSLTWGCPHITFVVMSLFYHMKCFALVPVVLVMLTMALPVKGPAIGLVVLDKYWLGETWQWNFMLINISPSLPGSNLLSCFGLTISCQL